MTTTIEAVYENGVLRPLVPIAGLNEHEKVRVSIQTGMAPHPLLKYCGTISDEDTREIEKIIADEFEKVDPNDWK
jgi:predicted DNA-binding antitoxin AbrB/MazE fold protein